MKKLLLVLALAACSDLTAPDGAVRIYPIPEQYRVWWGEIEQCSGLRGSINAVEFYQVPLTTDSYGGGRTRWRTGSPTLILMEPDVVMYERTVKHEMMHALGKWNSYDGHPPRYFTELCGNLMAGPPFDYPDNPNWP